MKRSPFKPKARGSYRIENKADKEATVYIYDEIGWFGVEASVFVKDLNEIKASTINIRLNSPGGNVFDGMAIFNAIKQHKSKTIMHIDGLAASISSIIALAGDEVNMAKNAMYVIHNPWTVSIGDSDLLRADADLLDKIKGMMVPTYMDKTGLKKSEIEALMLPPDPGKFETWMTADEAKEKGFIDTIEGEQEDEKAKATIFDLSVFANVPDQLKGKQEIDVNERDLERALRDAGCSRSQAKEVLAKGFAAIQDVRDAQTESDGQDERDAQTEETPLRDAEPVNQQDAKEPVKKKKDRTAELLTRGKALALSQTHKIKEVLK